MRFQNATKRQGNFLSKLEAGQEGIKRFKRDMELINQDTRFTPHHKESEYLKRKQVAIDIYKQNLNDVIKELEEGLNGHMKFIKRTEMEQLLDFMYFKEVISVGDVNTVLSEVKKNINNKVYLDLFNLHSEKLKARSLEQGDRADAEAIFVMKEEINELDQDKEIAELLSYLYPVKSAGIIYKDLDIMDVVDAEIISL